MYPVCDDVLRGIVCVVVFVIVRVFLCNVCVLLRI